MRFSRRAGAMTWRVATAMAAAGALCSCEIVTLEEARAIKQRQSGAFDARDYARSMWAGRAQEALKARAIPIAMLRNSPLDQLGARHGSKAGEGSPWTFVVSGEGLVRSVNREGPRGLLNLETQAGPAAIQIGPLVSGTAIRDALPFVTFDSFPDQIAFAEAGAQLNERALGGVGPVAGGLKTGDRISFAGVVSLRKPGDQLLITPFQIVAQEGGQ